MQIGNFVLQVQNCFSRSICVIISNKTLLISEKGLGERIKLLQWGPGRNPGSQSIFRFYIASNHSNAIKNIIWLINL